MILNYNIDKVIYYASTLTVLFPVCAGFVKNKTLSKEQRVLFLFVVTAALFELLLFILGQIKINNFFIFHIFTPLEFILLSGVYYYGTVLRPVKIVLVVIVSFFLALVLTDSFFSDKLKSVDSIASASESLLLIVYSLLFFFYLLKKLEYKNLFNNPMFWFNSGVLIYFSGNFFLFIFSNYMLHVSYSYFSSMWGIHDFLNLLINILFSIALWKR